MTISKQEIMAAKCGRPGAIAALLEKLDLVAKSLVARRRKATASARFEWDELKQDVLLRVMLILPTFEGADGGQLVRWVTTMVRTMHQDAVRRSQVRYRQGSLMKSIELEPGALRLPTPGISPLEAAAHDELIVSVRGALEVMPAMLRAAIELRIFRGLPLAQMATSLGLASANAAECRFRRALEWLRERILRTE